MIEEPSKSVALQLPRPPAVNRAARVLKWRNVSTRNRVMRILLVARDPEVAEAREAALKEAGFDVSSARDFRVLGELCKQHRFDLAVIGHAFEPEVKQAVAAILAECQPAPRILEIYVERPTLQNAAAVLGSLDVDDLVNQVRAMMRNIQSRSA